MRDDDRLRIWIIYYVLQLHDSLLQFLLSKIRARRKEGEEGLGDGFVCLLACTLTDFFVACDIYFLGFYAIAIGGGGHDIFQFSLFLSTSAFLHFTYCASLRARLSSQRTSATIRSAVRAADVIGQQAGTVDLRTRASRTTRRHITYFIELARESRHFARILNTDQSETTNNSYKYTHLTFRTLSFGADCHCLVSRASLCLEHALVRVSLSV